MVELVPSQCKEPERGVPMRSAWPQRGRHSGPEAGEAHALDVCLGPKI